MALDGDPASIRRHGAGELGTAPRPVALRSPTERSVRPAPLGSVPTVAPTSGSSCRDGGRPAAPFGAPGRGDAGTMPPAPPRTRR